MADAREAVETSAGAQVVWLPNGVGWVSECFPLGGQQAPKHEHVSLYLIPHEGKFIIVDSGSFYHRESIERKLKAETKEAGVGAMILSHSDYPHSANIGAFRRIWGDFEIVSSAGEPDIQGLPYATKAHIGGSNLVFGRKFSFIDPPLADRSHTSWIYDHESRTLFAADGFAHYHVPGECTQISPEFDQGIRAEDIYEFHRDNIGWLRYADPQKFRRKIEHLFSDFDVAFLAPIHGNPIAGEDLDLYVMRLTDAVQRIASGYQPTGSAPLGEGH